jgi:hypothetical protein
MDGRSPSFEAARPALVAVSDRFHASNFADFSRAGEGAHDSTPAASGYSGLWTGCLFARRTCRTGCLACLIVFGAAIVLELLQIVIPDRDARVIDAFEKLAGGATGVWAARASHSFVAPRLEAIDSAAA